jgi:hypothetical protein
MFGKKLFGYLLDERRVARPKSIIGAKRVAAFITLREGQKASFESWGELASPKL